MDATTPKKYRPYNSQNIHKIAQLSKFSNDFILTIQTIAKILPFRTNNYVIDELIDWDNLPQDPIFQLTFPQPGMLDWIDIERLNRLQLKNVSPKEMEREIHKIRMRLNPHPAGQMDLNVPFNGSRLLRGIQHKYNETVLFFPAQGQTCHAFCTYCFRWAQFVGNNNLKFTCNDINYLIQYVKLHPEVTDVLFTGGDAMVMNIKLLRKYIDPLLKAGLPHLSSIRIGTKVLAYWPYRFLTDTDAEAVLRLLEKVVKSGIHLSIMSHFSHPRELETVAAERAIRRLIDTGVTIRCQAPLIRNINDDAHVLARMWKSQVRLGAIPYYMFVSRDTGPKQYFRLSLIEAYTLFTEAYRQISGLCRTVRGPSMSATPGKVLIDGIAEIGNEKVFVLKFIQARQPEWVNQIFFARYSERACWLDDLQPAQNAARFFFEEELERMKAGRNGYSNAVSF